jgi:small subunit ribosomal protein S20
MPTIKSAFKRVRTSATSAQRNRSVKSAIATARRRMVEALDSGERTAADERFRKYCSVLDKAVKKGTLKANTASRYKSRAAHRLAVTA